MKNSFGEGSELDGYEDLRPEDQAKVIKAWQDGHVAEEDIPESARKPADEEDAEKPKKKRAPAKKKAAESDGEAVERPKRKAGVAKVRSLLSNGCTLFINHGIYISQKAAAEDDEDDEEDEEEKPKKKRAPPKKKAEPKEKSAPKKRASKKKKEVGVFCLSSVLCAISTSFHLGV